MTGLATFGFLVYMLACPIVLIAGIAKIPTLFKTSWVRAGAVAILALVFLGIGLYMFISVSGAI